VTRTKALHTWLQLVNEDQETPNLEGLSDDQKAVTKTILDFIFNKTDSTNEVGSVPWRHPLCCSSGQWRCWLTEAYSLCKVGEGQERIVRRGTDRKGGDLSAAALLVAGARLRPGNKT